MPTSCPHPLAVPFVSFGGGAVREEIGVDVNGAVGWIAPLGPLPAPAWHPQWMRSKAEVAHMLKKLIAALQDEVRAMDSPRPISGAVSSSSHHRTVAGGSSPSATVAQRIAPSLQEPFHDACGHGWMFGDVVSTHAATETFEFVSDEEVGESLESSGVTLMIRNISITLTEEMLLEEWPADGSYDLLYLPRNAGGKANLGYAFVNFTSEAHAAAFRARWQRRRLAQCPGARPLSISRAEVQGFEANIADLKAKPARRMRSRRSKPLIIRDGRWLQLDEV